MAESTRIRGMNVERTVEQILNAMEDDDEEIHRETENSDFYFSDEGYQINTPPSLGSHYSDTEAVIPCLTDSVSESEDEDEDSFNALPTTSTDSSATSGFWLTPSDLNTRTGKDGTVWSSFSSPQGRMRSHNIINTRLHGVCASDIYSPKDAFQFFFSEKFVEEISCVHTCKVDGSLRNGMLYKKTNS